MATPQKSGKGKETEVVDNVQEALSKFEQFIEKNQRTILMVVGGLVLIVCAVLAFRNFYLAPREKEAEAQIYKAQYFFERDSFQLALTGNNEFLGFEAIKDQYSLTKTAKLANAYIGLCYKELGQYEQALKYLKDFNASDEMISPAIIIAVGDCYVENGKIKEAINYFLKAADKAENDLISPFALKKAAVAYEELKEYDKAVNTYTLIKEKYYNSNEGYNIDKFIERAKALASNK